MCHLLLKLETDINNDDHVGSSSKGCVCGGGGGGCGDRTSIVAL